MAIWKLEPLDSNDRNWAASAYEGAAIVRAPVERTARELAARAFGLATPVIPGEKVEIVPRDYDGLVRCTRIAHTKQYPEAGEDGVLLPRGQY